MVEKRAKTAFGTDTSRSRSRYPMTSYEEYVYQRAAFVSPSREAHILFLMHAAYNVQTIHKKGKVL
jgi:hypothetical protein